MSGRVSSVMALPDKTGGQQRLAMSDGTTNEQEACCEKQRPEKELGVCIGRSVFIKWTNSSLVTAWVHRQHRENY